MSSDELAFLKRLVADLRDMRGRLEELRHVPLSAADRKLVEEYKAEYDVDLARAERQLFEVLSAEQPSSKRMM